MKVIPKWDSKIPVLVIWSDAAGIPDAWINPKEIGSSDLRCYSVGFIIKEFPDHIVMAGSKFRDDSLVGDVNRIPKSMISAIVPLRIAHA